VVHGIERPPPDVLRQTSVFIDDFMRDMLQSPKVDSDLHEGVGGDADSIDKQRTMRAPKVRKQKAE